MKTLSVFIKWVEQCYIKLIKNSVKFTLTILLNFHYYYNKMYQKTKWKNPNNLIKKLKQLIKSHQSNDLFHKAFLKPQ